MVALVGRDRELAALRAALAQVAGGTPHAVVVTGPTGMGKTRLTQEARALGVAAGLRSVVSRSDALSREVAYAPVAAAFGPLLRNLDKDARGGLVGDLPQLSLVFSGLGLPDPTPFAEPDLRRIRLLDGLTRLLDRLSRGIPLLWVLDDVHAADTETRRLLAHLAVALPDSPVLLLLTARDDEPAGDHVHPLTKAFGESSWQLTRLELAPLDDADAAGLAAAVLEHPLAEPLAQAVVARGVGRPLFLESLSQSLIDSGSLEMRDGRLSLRSPDLPLPADVRQQLRARLSPLADPAREVLQTLAVAGAPLEHPVLCTVCGLTVRELGETLARLERRRLVARSPDDGYDVAHGLLRDAVLADLAPATVAALHAELARARAAHDPEDHRLAEHVLRAGSLLEPETAAPWLVAAARHARLVGATGDARRYLEAAVGLLRVRRPAGSGCQPADLLADLLADLGELCVHLGDHQAARAWCDQAITEYQALGRPDGLSRVHRLLATLEWNLGDPGAAERGFERAEAVLAGLEPGPELADLLHARMVAANRVGDLDGLERVGARLRELAARIGSPDLAVRSHLAAGVAAYSRGDYSRMAQENARALEAAQGLEEPELLVRVHDQISVCAGSCGDLATLRRHSLESLRIAREAGALTWEPWPRVRVAFADLLAGDLDAGLRGTSEVLGYLDRFPHPRGEASLCGAHALMLAHAGRLKEARGYVERALAVAGQALRADRNIFSSVALGEATLALAEGDPVDARRAAAPLLDMRGGWLPQLGLAVYGEACAAAGRVDEAFAVALRLRGVVSCDTDLPDMLADWVSGLAATDPDQAAELLAAARAGFERLGLALHAARAALAQARALHATRPADAVEPARAALAALDRIGIPQDALAARELLRSLGVTPSRGRGRTSGDGPLSARELEVARLVAAGMTNAEVATELFISPRTVSTHLDRIYARLGLSSRAALTRYLADSGLLEPEIT
ncbi:MAG TPA: AAA family ATPase [Nocardioidaceae bacterium]|nr:AAA family ATPase [Nocardioidaceae bacterium]